MLPARAIVLKLIFRIHFLIFSAIALSILFFACIDKNANLVEGTFMEEVIPGDSVQFSTGHISSKYFQSKSFRAKVEDQMFKLTYDLSYPHMFKMRLASEHDKIPFRVGNSFLDNTVTAILVDSLGECTTNDGNTTNEYTNNFIPHFLSDSRDYNCTNMDFRRFLVRERDAFEIKLVEYVRQNPNSYVALWYLIEELYEFGYSPILEESVQLFSEKMKSKVLWQILDSELGEITIRTGNEFPEFKLKSLDLTETDFSIQNSKYVLVDFWFSRCRPCLKNMPKLKELYSSYGNKGFEIVGVSIDKTSNIENWKEVVKKFSLPWNNYLDENALEASKNKIFRFPTYILLDRSGRVIDKNIGLEELEKFLENRLSPNGVL